MGGSIPAWWHLTARCTGTSAEAIGERAEELDHLQWEGAVDERSALVSVRYLAQSSTMRGVLVQGVAQLRRAFGSLVTGIEPTALAREEDLQVFDVDTLEPYASSGG